MRMVGGSYRTAWLLIPWALYSVNASQDNRNRDLAGRSPPPPPPPPPRPGDPRQYADSNFPDNGDFPEAQSTAYWDEIEQDFPAGEQNYRRRRSRPPPKNAFGGPTSDYRDQDLGDYRNDYPEPEGSWPYESKQPPSPLGGTSNDRVSMRPPPENAQQYAPIHYNFPKEKEKKKKFGFFGRKKKDKDATPPPLFSEMEDSTRRQRSRPTTDDGDEDFIPETFSAPPPRDRFTRDSDDNAPMYQSPRRDVITQFRSTFNGRVILALSSGIAGSLLGAFLGKSILNRPGPLASFFFALFFFCNFLRNPYGEFVRALGMALILALRRTRYIRKSYPTWCHVKASIRAVDRQPFPPTANPWAYRPEREDDPEFRMLYTVIAMAFVGSTCGGNVPLIPTWMGSLAGAGFFALSTTMNSPRGDLTRTMGMRVVALCYEILGINHELDIIRKGGVVAGKILDKIFILDRKHRIKDRLIAAGSFAYRQIYKQINKVQDEMQEEPVTGRPDGRRGPAEDTGRPGERRGRAPDGERGPPGERRRPPPEGGPRNRRPPDTARDTFPMR